MEGRAAVHVEDGVIIRRNVDKRLKPGTKGIKRRDDRNTADR